LWFLVILFYTKTVFLICGVEHGERGGATCLLGGKIYIARNNSGVT
jgi:hypothetical protein